jgi:hypothetical protein
MDFDNSSLETVSNSIAKDKLRHHGPLPGPQRNGTSFKQIEGFTGWEITYSVCP